MTEEDQPIYLDSRRRDLLQAFAGIELIFRRNTGMSLPVASEAAVEPPLDSRNTPKCHCPSWGSKNAVADTVHYQTIRR